MNSRTNMPTESTLKTLGAFLVEAACETLWPTRCAVCDEQGSVLCDRCARELPYIDYWRACPRCGAPFGSILCTECNPVMLQTIGRETLPYRSCTSAVAFDAAAARIVTAYKDRGEQRLATAMAHAMAPLAAPSWTSKAEAPPVVTFVPATSAARRRRGFDHAELLAEQTAEQLGLSVRFLLDRPASKDQRSLGRKDRARNTAGRFSALPDAKPCPSVLLVDDVCTTGSTLAGATDALVALGCETVRCLTFARVW